MDYNRWLKRIAALAVSVGFRVERTKGGHVRFVPPDKTKQVVHVSGTASDWKRAQRNAEADLRRAGLAVG